ncbi:nucleotide sugar dehydrogenase [Amycolatopsis sp. NPDC059021]|uniref:nucleotide sugar dehydrogenase n=1 Tax=Amycolatopsis sp. NPDC059021 TaxID=3346704 RepID=UPI00366D87E3
MTASLPATRHQGSPCRVAVVGLGYVGLPTALALHAAGMTVLGIDRDERRIAAIARGEADLVASDRRLLASAAGDERFVLTTDAGRLPEADVVMVCVPTPVDAHLAPELGALRQACETLVRQARPGQTLILTSTSFVGTARQLLVEPLETRGFTVGKDLFVAASPERIDPGRVTHTQRETPRVLGGVTPACTRRAQEVLGLVSGSAHVVGSPEAAEMTKLFENSFRAVNIALANEFADVCTSLSLDPMEIVTAAATKPYGFMAFQPGPGVGGHCIPCDPHYLLWQLRASRGSAPIVAQAMQAIADRPRQVADRVLDVLSRTGKGIAGTRVVVVGVTYKPGVRDVRSSSALDVIGLLAARGAKVDYHDPLVPSVELPNGSTVDSVVGPLGGDWDLALIHTVQPGHDYGWLEQCPIVVDATYRFLPADAAPRAEDGPSCVA